MELGLSVNHGQIVRAIKERPLPESSVFSRWAYEGQIVEVQESYHKWYAAWQPLWKCGTMVTIDYGEMNDTLYHRRPAGTLRGYKAHQLVAADELPTLTGRCDITADVNFTDLQQLAANCVGDRVQYMSQYDYLKDLADPTSAADRHLIAVPGAGDHFNVLIQHRFES
jgi:SAM-dependent MidA family methyltransferase